jgi:hypothetical protein
MPHDQPKASMPINHQGEVPYVQCRLNAVAVQSTLRNSWMLPTLTYGLQCWSLLCHESVQCVLPRGSPVAMYMV